MAYAQEHIKPYSAEGEKSQQVEEMFDNIAPTYDFLNHLLSLGIDRHWRRAALDTLKVHRPQRMLDVATGTGDFAILAARRLSPQSLLGVDLSEGMMAVARDKVAKAGLDGVISFQKEDCLNLSLPTDSFDAITVAYGIRNFQHLEQGLSEMLRVLRPGGHLVIIELTAPRRFPMKQLFWLYSHVAMPLIGRIVSRDARAYTYLPHTMEVFPQGEQMQQILQKVGFSDVQFKRFTFGLSTLYTACKPTVS
ncbi:MAG: bifunctional demethylmenaquinone methyltransferase/2-methoxy-6-polyprenyl-1,4-benzoquinol methylase UbiE [Bacteroidaceae bacterium]|nr:bifunctional demethylmenaquinone methyltransferase/2-methoxy-6-polyprenyl-1,4-benzoquinol methylase UbiE [Bacteroidaceae bacterium]